MNKIKIGMIGAGRMGQRHLNILKDITEVAICGVADPVESCRKEVCSTFGLTGYSSLDELLEKEKPDAVYLTTPIALHYENIKTAMQANVHIFCEKPLVPTNEEAEKIKNLADQYEKILFTGLAWRYDSTVLSIKKAVLAGEIGAIRQFRAICGGPSSGKRPTWFENRETAVRGCMLDNGVHFFDMLAWTLEDKFTQAAAFNDQTMDKVDINSCILLKTAGNVTGCLQFSSETLMGASVEYYGTDGTILFYPGNFEYIVKRAGKEDETVKVPENARFADMSAAFIKAMQDGNTSPVSVADALHASAVAEAGYKSTETGKFESVTSL